MSKTIGLYFGTFNPIHIGHLVIANYMAEFSELDEVWFVITPQSPFKKKATLLDDHHRYQMVYEATKDYPKLKPSKIEFGLPQPNYTVHTLAHLTEKYGSEYQFALIMGSDNLVGFHRWKNYEVILENHDIFVYPRVGTTTAHPFKNHPKVHVVNAPIMELSATFIRTMHASGKNIRPMLPDAVWTYMDEMNFYR
ncbi:nicotinate (nicotinamide) nucleotide adenylyltransferase [Arenibacter sp. GZD96]|uniref:nicotinate (nicotinamide) nucleotide adenylyltransferase n=1 Tax=Aurantibrevibacter litoralis TaxID=3106030 RepID=UPI002AFE366C|nr:nicotinate (nicotinamide) nucleotide adenylyltransferase [Arenibacter sp. GZD-96]MEA1787606.1 nicotinate (nicotinamide) nucleotide adenylyltransferase [Arenibacter sp. GZD-96]